MAYDIAGPKSEALRAFTFFPLALILGFLISFVPPFPGSELLFALPGFSILVGFWLAVRIRCPHCGVALAKSFPFKGGVVLLWAVRERCPKCHKPLGWRHGCA